MNGHIIQWDEIIGLLLKLSRKVLFIRDAESLGHGTGAAGSSLAIINKEPEQEQKPKRWKLSQDMEKESSWQIDALDRASYFQSFMFYEPENTLLKENYEIF